MCKHCEGLGEDPLTPDPSTPPLHTPTRRTLLKTLALSAAALLSACSDDPSPMGPSPSAATTNPASTDPAEQLEGEAPKPAIAVDPHPIVVPPPLPPKVTEYGEIMLRAAWTTAPMEFNRGKAMGGVSRITIHHSGDGKVFAGETVADVARHLQIVQRAHFQRGMIDIAYHFAVDPAGRVWQLRSLLYEGQHVRVGKNGVRWNAHNVGIVTLGDFNIQAPTLAQRTRLISFAHIVRRRYGLGPGAVHMHGELVQTDCPGKGLVPWVKEARAKAMI